MAAPADYQATAARGTAPATVAGAGVQPRQAAAPGGGARQAARRALQGQQHRAVRRAGAHCEQAPVSLQHAGAAPSAGACRAGAAPGAGLAAAAAGRALLPLAVAAVRASMGSSRGGGASHASGVACGGHQ